MGNALIAIDGQPPSKRERFGSIPPRLALSPDALQATIAAARDSTLALARIREQMRERVGAK
jgi:hypothetical protein